MSSDNKKLGCCNLVIWDFLVIAFVAIQFMIQQVRPWLGILIGIAIAAIFVVLCNVKYIGHILQVIAGLFWAWMIWDMFDVGNLEIAKDDPVGQWVFAIILGLFFVGAHFISHNNITGGISFKNKSKKRSDSSRIETNYNNEMAIEEKCIVDFELHLDQFLGLYKALNKKNEEYFYLILSKNSEDFSQRGIVEEFVKKSDNLIDDFNLQLDSINEILETKDHEYIRRCLSKMKSLMDEILEIENQISLILRIAKDKVTDESDNNKKDATFNGFDPFAGCNDKESLTKRYKGLVKQFHPDVANGDTEQLQWLNNRYNELCNQMVD